ncbi:hypothetical protein ABPG72_019835 [Tetrahymena utriculariae]
MSEYIASKEAQLCTQENISTQLVKQRSPCNVKKKLLSKHKLTQALKELSDTADQLIIPRDERKSNLKQTIQQNYPQYAPFLEQLTTVSSCRMFAEINQNKFIIKNLNSTCIQDYQENITSLMSQFIYFQFEKQMTPISPQFFLELWELIINVIINEITDINELIKEIQHFVIKSYLFHQIDEETYRALITGVQQNHTEGLIRLFYRDNQLTDQQYLSELYRLASSLQKEESSKNWFGNNQSSISMNNQAQIRKWTSSLILESLEAISYSQEESKHQERQLLFLKKALICIQQFLKLSQHTLNIYQSACIPDVTYTDGQQFISTQLQHWENNIRQPYSFPDEQQLVILVTEDNNFLKMNFLPDYLMLDDNFQQTLKLTSNK